MLNEAKVFVLESESFKERENILKGKVEEDK